MLERGQAEKFPGNMLTRPGLILNPWSVRTTNTTLQDARVGGAYDLLREMPDMKEGGGAGGGGAGGGLVEFANLDFLKDGTFLAANLEPNKDGFVEWWLLIPSSWLPPWSLCPRRRSCGANCEWPPISIREKHLLSRSA